MSGPTTSFVQVADTTQPSKGNKVVAGYSLQRKLGSGSFAVVYKGVRLSPSPQHADFVAIKAIARSSEKLTKKVLQNLEIEITILRKYRHKNIVCLHDVQKTDRHFYLILEYCGGGDMQWLIRSRKAGRLTEGLTRRLMRDLSAGLMFLWGQELIHRDIKPQNLLLTGALPLEEVDDPDKTEEMYRRRVAENFPSAKFALKIADFGFARHLQTTSLAETLCGSPLYMAPEILQHHRYDAKADVWSVGTVLFEMISGKPPFHGENHIDLLRNIQRKAVRLPADVKVSKECVNLLRLLLNRNPLSRAGFKEFFEASDAFVACGCRGLLPSKEDNVSNHGAELGTIEEQQPQNTESLLTVATIHQQEAKIHEPHQIGQQFFNPTPANTTRMNSIGLAAGPLPVSQVTPKVLLNPIVASPNASGNSAASPRDIPSLPSEMPPAYPPQPPQPYEQQHQPSTPNNSNNSFASNNSTSPYPQQVQPTASPGASTPQPPLNPIVPSLNTSGNSSASPQDIPTLPSESFPAYRLQPPQPNQQQNQPPTANSSVNSVASNYSTSPYPQQVQPTANPGASHRPPFVDPETHIVHNCSNADYEGWLMKQSAWLKDWRRRYFILKDSKLFFAKDELGAPHGMIDLSHCNTVKSANLKTKRGHSFEISTPDTQYLLYADTESERDDWIGRVGEAIVLVNLP